MSIASKVVEKFTLYSTAAALGAGKGYWGADRFAVARVPADLALGIVAMGSAIALAVTGKGLAFAPTLSRIGDAALMSAISGEGAKLGLHHQGRLVANVDPKDRKTIAANKQKAVVGSYLNPGQLRSFAKVR